MNRCWYIYGNIFFFLKNKDDYMFVYVDDKCYNINR